MCNATFSALPRNSIHIGAKLGGAGGALAPPYFLSSPGICFKIVHSNLDIMNLDIVNFVI